MQIALSSLASSFPPAAPSQPIMYNNSPHSMIVQSSGYRSFSDANGFSQHQMEKPQIYTVCCASSSPFTTHVLLTLSRCQGRLFGRISLRNGSKPCRRYEKTFRLLAKCDADPQSRRRGQGQAHKGLGEGDFDRGTREGSRWLWKIPGNMDQLSPWKGILSAVRCGGYSEASAGLRHERRRKRRSRN